MEKRGLFEEFEKLTEELLLIDMSKDTDEIIDLIEKLLEKRDEVIENIKSSTDKSVFDEDDLARILQKNNQIETKFTEIKLGISDSISKIVDEKSLSSKMKKAHRGYLNIGKQSDGYFIDKKK